MKVYNEHWSLKLVGDANQGGARQGRRQGGEQRQEAQEDDQEPEIQKNKMLTTNILMYIVHVLLLKIIV